jgi:hypothetical protein
MIHAVFELDIHSDSIRNQPGIYVHVDHQGKVLYVGRTSIGVARALDPHNHGEAEVCAKSPFLIYCTCPVELLKQAEAWMIARLSPSNNRQGVNARADRNHPVLLGIEMRIEREIRAIRDEAELQQVRSIP